MSPKRPDASSKNKLSAIWPSTPFVRRVLFRHIYQSDVGDYDYSILISGSILYKLGVHSWRPYLASREHQELQRAGYAWLLAHWASARSSAFYPAAPGPCREIKKIGQVMGISSISSWWAASSPRCLPAVSAAVGYVRSRTLKNLWLPWKKPLRRMLWQPYLAAY